MQLMLRVDTTMNNGEIKTLDILIDTGAEANLVRTGLVPRHLTTIARTRLNLVTANGQTLGGRRANHRSQSATASRGRRCVPRRTFGV